MDDVLDEHHSAVDQDAEIYCAHRDQVGRERSEEHTSELQSRLHLVCRLLLEKKNNLATRANDIRLFLPFNQLSPPTPTTLVLSPSASQHIPLSRTTLYRLFYFHTPHLTSMH